MNIDNDDNNGNACFALEKGKNNGGISSGNSTGNDTVHDKNAHQAGLLVSIICINEEYSLGHLIVFPDLNAATSAVFESVELQAPAFFISHSVVHTGRLT
jgi:hypothetical protein